ncbi:GntR family transcriptional regulator [Natranaerovirga hydrolytica]|uniref:GntR family transcriptional regulator n=1 Tax=Natranaerovirga hydrolytica TaxID=680378 RepID=A0A4R1MKM7_9FIRM|nr:GntR family transcriptional regulator [Natranaerovirga hydrolytica]TCK93286.1 GntR family transcriptional regulator [Natranaerovirga hydrolytica]
MEDKLKVNLNEYLPLRDVVFNALREAILKGELNPGERLMEKQLAERMGVSRTPIREAIRKLELEGLVVMVPRKGAEVARITQKALKDVLEVRCALEELAVKIACEKVAQKEIKALRETMEAFNQAVNKGDVEKIVEKDVEFHDIIFNSTDNEKLIQILNNLREQIYRYRVEYIKKTDNHQILVKEHEEILNAIESKNVEKAQEVAQQHIINQETTIIKFIKENGSNIKE